MSTWVGSTFRINEYQESHGEWVESGRRVRQPHRHLRSGCLDDVGSSTSHVLTGLHCLLQGYLYLYLLVCTVFR
jgi:hypothetical protein